MSDVAYAKTLILNSHEVWEEELEVRAKMAKYTENTGKVCKLLTQTIRKDVLGREPKVAEYTRRKGVCRKYLGHGWNKEGITTNEELWELSRKFTKNAVLWEKMGCAWEQYVDGIGFEHEWKKDILVPEASDEYGDDYKEELLANRFALSGYEHFEGDFVKENIRDGSADSDKEEGDILHGIKEDGMEEMAVNNANKLLLTLFTTISSVPSSLIPC